MKRFTLALLSLIFILSSGCVRTYQKYATKTVVQVNDHTLTAQEFSLLLARRLKGLDALSAKDPLSVERAKQEIVKNFITRSLILDYARAHDIQLENKDLEKEIEKIRAGYPDDLSFRKELAQESISFADWREQLRFLLIEKLVFQKISEKNKPLSEDDLKKYYEQRKDFFKRKERIYFRQIVLEDEARAEIILADLKKRSFEDLAKRYSITPEGKDGGLVGWIEKGNVDYFDPLFTKPVGVALAPFKSPFGYHIVKIEKKSPASVLPFESVRPLLSQELLAKREQAAFVSWLDAQLRASRVLKDTDLLNSIKIETRGEK